MEWSEFVEKQYKEHQAIYGDNHMDRLYDQTIEEAAELIVAIQHLRRSRCKPIEVMGEYADLVMCVEFLLRTWQPVDNIRDAIMADAFRLRFNNLEYKLSVARALDG